MFHSWASRVPEHVEIVGIELPGRGARIKETPIPDLNALALGAADAITRNGDTRFAFFGHSMGALLAFETTRRLRLQGAPQPCHLFVSGCRAPHLRSERKPVASMSDEEFLIKLQDLNGTPDSVMRDPELMELVLPVLKADFAAVDGWKLRPERNLNVPITALGGSSDGHVSLEAVEAWRDHTRQEFQFRTFAGDHFFIHPKEEILVNLIIRTLQMEAWI